MLDNVTHVHVNVGARQHSPPYQWCVEDMGDTYGRSGVLSAGFQHLVSTCSIVRGAVTLPEEQEKVAQAGRRSEGHDYGSNMAMVFVCQRRGVREYGGTMDNDIEWNLESDAFERLEHYVVSPSRVKIGEVFVES